MLKGLTSTFKNGCNNAEVMYREYLVLGNQTIPIKAELNDDSYENGNFIGTFIFKTIKFETDAQYDFKNKEFEYYKEVNGESVKIGTFITTEVEINDTTEIVKIVGMDYGLKTQVSYRSQLNYSAGNITLLDVWNEACQLSGLESGIDYFPNGDFIVDNDQFTGTGATIRDVFKGIAMSSGSFVKVMNDDKIYLVFNSYTGDIETTTISGSGSVNDGYAIDNLQIEGKAEQHSYSGKNYANINKDPDWKYGNTVWKRSGSNVTVKNNGTSTYAFVEYYVDNLKPNTVYTISMDAVANENGYIRLSVGYPRDTGGTTSIRTLNTSGKQAHLTGQFTTPSDTSNLCITLYSVSGTYKANASVTYSNIQIEEGSSETSYEPFTNNLPTPNPYYPEEIKTVSGIGNLFDKEDASPTTTATTVTQIDTGIQIKNNTAGYGAKINITNLKQNTNYYLSYNWENVSNGHNRVFVFAGTGTSTTLGSKTNGDFVSFNTGNNTTINIWFYAQNNAIGEVKYKNIQLEESSTPHQYVPYGHWLPVKVSNKNLLNNTLVSGSGSGLTWTVNEDKSVTINGTNKSGATRFIRIAPNFTLPAGTYTLSNGNTNVSNNTFIFYDDKGRFSRTNISTVTFTQNTEIAPYIKISAGATVNNETIYPMIEESSTATKYIEHQEQTTLIDLNKYDENNNIVGNYELCSIRDIKDLLTIKDGKVIINKDIEKLTFNGTETIENSGGYNGLFQIKNIMTYPYKSILGMSNYFTNSLNMNITDNSSANNYLKDGQFAFRWNFSDSNRDRIYFKYLEMGTDVDAFKTWLSTHNTEVYYQLSATETITLRGTYDINLYEGVNHISIEDELEPTMTLSYYNNNLDIIEDYVELEDKRDTRPWTCLRLGMSQVEGENVDYIDEELVAKYGENWLILNDNPFAYTQQKRQQLITNIFNRIKEFGYSAFVSKTSFKPYLTAGDIVKFRNREGNLVKTILLRYNHNAEEITLESPSETSATVNYVYPLTDIDLYKRTEIQVDKANNQIRTNVDNIGLLQTSSSSNADNINTLTSLVDSQGKDIKKLGTRIEQNVGSINASVTAIQGEIKKGVGLVKTTSVTIDDKGLSVSTDTSKIQTTMTNDTFKIADKSGTELAKFGYDESQGISVAEMDNLTVKNYFVAGVHRLEKIEIDGEERTGWFYMGG